MGKTYTPFLGLSSQFTFLLTAPKEPGEYWLRCFLMQDDDHSADDGGLLVYASSLTVGTKQKLVPCSETHLVFLAAFD